MDGSVGHEVPGFRWYTHTRPDDALQSAAPD